MNGIPESIDGALLVGATLIQICVGQNEVILHFSNGTAVTIECQVGVGVAGDPISWESGAVKSGAAFLPLLGADVVHMAVLSRAQMEIRFSPDARVILCDSNSHYESFSIQKGDLRITV